MHGPMNVKPQCRDIYIYIYILLQSHKVLTVHVSKNVLDVNQEKTEFLLVFFNHYAGQIALNAYIISFCVTYMC